MAALAKALLQSVALLWLALLGSAGWFIYKRKYRLAAMQGGMALALFFVGSSPMSGWLLSRLEAPYGRTNWGMLPEADAVVVLGGFGGGSDSEIIGIDFNTSVDRLLTGIELTHRGKAPVLVLGGGGYWKNGKLEPEAGSIRPWMKKWGLAKDIPIHDLGVCANTYEESQKFAALARKEGWKTVLLVTSASHMKRAEAVFLSSGVDVTPVACDFAAWHHRRDWEFFPSIGRLKTVQIWMYESAGWLYYRSKGWIQLDALPEK
jgi:uncharacterized SAM-binding protein YcdF (DUF218 family)